MSESKKEQLRNLENMRRRWEDDPDNRTPYPLIGLIESLGSDSETGVSPDPGEPVPPDDPEA